MNFISSQKNNPGLFLLMAFSAWILSQSLSIEITKVIFSILGYDSSIVQTVLAHGTKNEENIRLVYDIILPVNQIFTFGFIGFLFAHFSGYSWIHHFSISSKRNYFLILIPIATLALVPLLQYVIWDADTFHLPAEYQSIENQLKQIENQTKETQSIIINQSFWICLIIMAVLPAICEEIFFRYFLLNNLRQNMSNTVAIILNGFIFSFIHFQVYGFIARWILGCFFAWASIRASSILPAIFAHFTNNALMVILAFLAVNQKIDSKFAEDNYQFPMLISLISLLIFASIVYFIEKKSSENGQKPT